MQIERWRTPLACIAATSLVALLCMSALGLSQTRGPDHIITSGSWQNADAVFVLDGNYATIDASGAQAAVYALDFDLPSDATITGAYVTCNGMLSGGTVFGKLSFRIEPGHSILYPSYGPYMNGTPATYSSDVPHDQLALLTVEDLNDGTCYIRMGYGIGAGVTVHADWFTVTIEYDVPPPPSWHLAWVSDELIEDDDAGEVFSIAIQFDQPMDTSVSPTLRFEPGIATVLALESDRWLNDTTYEANYRVLVSNAHEPWVVTNVSGQCSVTGNCATEGSDLNPLFSIDMRDVRPRPTLQVTPTGTGEGTGAFLDATIPDDDEPLIVHGQCLSARYELGTSITGGCTIARPETGRAIVSSYLIVELYALTFERNRTLQTQVWHSVYTYDRAAGAYIFEIETEDLHPGYYDVRLVFADGTSQTCRIEIVPALE